MNVISNIWWIISNDRIILKEDEEDEEYEEVESKYEIENLDNCSETEEEMNEYENHNIDFNGSFEFRDANAFVRKKRHL